jgi:hypothetical protein
MSKWKPPTDAIEWTPPSDAVEEKGASSEVGAASGVDSNAPQQPSIPSGASPEYLKQLSEKNFVKRINNPSKFIKNADGSKSTHKMATAEVDGKQIAFPTIVEQNGKLVELPINEAIDFALKNNEFAEFAKAEDAQWYAEGGYKKGTPLENLEKSPQQADGNTLLPSGRTLNEQRQAVLSHASKITPQQDRKLRFVEDNEAIPFSTRQKALKGTQFESVAPLSEQPIAGERNKQLESQLKQNERQNEKSSLAVLAESHRNNLSKDVDYKTTQEKFNSAYENWQNGQGSPEDVKLAESELNSQLELLDRDYIGNEATKRGALAFMEKKDKYDQITSKVKAGESISETEKKFLYDLRKEALSAKAAAERVALMDIEDSVDISTFNKEIATLAAIMKSMTADEYDAKVQEITQRTGVNNDVINSLDLGYKELASTVELSKITEAQNRNIETERGLDKMRSEQRKEGAYMIPEALRGLVGAMGTMTLSAAKLPKSLMGLDDETKYDWTDKLYDFAENEVDESQGTWGALQDAPAYLKYSYMLGQGVGSVAMFAAGGGVSAAVGMPSTVGTIGTAFIMSQPDNYTEAINSGMSAQEARIYSNTVSSAEAFAEGIIKDPLYFKQQIGKTVLSAYKQTGSVKEALKVIPKVIEGMAVSGSKEGAEEVVQTFAGDVTKSFLDTVAGSEYYNSTWNTESYKDAILSGALTGGFMKMFGSSKPKSEDTLNVMRDMIDSRESIVSNIAKFNPELSTQVDEVLSKAEEAKIGLESHSKWNDLTTAAQNKALDLVWQMELAEDAKKRVEQFGIVDENRNKESERLAKELNDVFTDDANTKRYADTVIRQLQQARAELGVEFDPMEDLPESVVKTFDRVDEGLPTDPVAVKEASDWLYSKYKQLSEMKNDDNRKLTIEQIEAIQLQLGEDIDKLENYRNENEQQQRTEEKTQPETEATDGAITEAEKQQIRKEIITFKAPEITVESNTAEVLEEVKQGEDGIVEQKTELVDGGQTEEIKPTDNVSESDRSGGVDGGSGVDGVLEGGEDVKAGTEAKREQGDALKNVESTAKALEGKDKKDAHNLTNWNLDKSKRLKELQDKEDDDVALTKSEQKEFDALNTEFDLVDVDLLSKEHEDVLGWLFDVPHSKNTSKAISEAYHKAKADGSNPELVKAVESLLSKEPATEENVSKEPAKIDTKTEQVDQVDTKVENRGNSSEIKFTSEKKVPTTYRLIEADELQPSHLSSGERNPMHQIASAQPKERNDAGSKMAQDKIANDPNIAEVGESPNAYFGAPIVNKRGEVIQGNNRSIGLKKHYRGNGKKYKADLEAMAEKFGFTKEQVAGMKNPILVREVDVNDQEAIELGQYDVKDLETGGKQRIDPIATSRKISPSDKAKIASIVFSGDFKTIKESIRANSKKVAEVLKAYLNPAQGKNTFNSDGSFTSQGMDDVSAVISNFLFDGGKAVLPEVFDKLPFTAKEGIQKALPYILSVSDNKSLKSHVQNAMLAFYEFNSSGQTNFDAWSNELDLFTGGSPKDAFLPIELAIAKKLIDAKSQNEIKDIFQKYEALTSDKPADMFNEAQEGMSKADAIKQQFNVEYNENEQRTDAKPQSEVSGERVDSGKKAEKTQSTTIFTELEAADKGRSVKARTEAKKALKEKYGDIIEKAKDINKNFDSYVEKLKAKGIITKVKC